MACALRDKGHEIIMGCQPQSDILERAKAAHLPVEPIRMRQDYDLPAAWKVAQTLKRRHVDLLHAQHSTAHALGLMAAVLAKVPAFAVTRRVVFPLRGNIFSRLKYKSSRINGYIAISDSVKNELVNGGINPSRIEVIPSIVHRQPLPRSEGVSLRQELKIPADSPMILNVANYADFKGQDVLMAAAAEVLKRVPKAVFVFAGRSTEDLTGLANQLQIASQVRLMGFRDDVPRFLAAADLFVMPSLQEAAGTALREAMLATLPVIGTRVGGIPESITEGQTGLLVSPGDASALAKAILQLLENPTQAKELARRGQEEVRSRFSLEAASQQMEKFYRRLLNGHATS
jgi:glycosyltransferase involved in cell wall biosynthesis